MSKRYEYKIQTPNGGFLNSANAAHGTTHGKTWTAPGYVSLAITNSRHAERLRADVVEYCMTEVRRIPIRDWFAERALDKTQGRIRYLEEKKMEIERELAQIKAGGL